MARFNAGIDEYLQKVERRKKAGEPLTAREEQIWKGRAEIEFGRKLILEGLVERYPGILNGKGEEGVMDDFIEYLHGRFDLTEERIGEQVHRLVAAGCLHTKAIGRKTGIAWT